MDSGRRGAILACLASTDTHPSARQVYGEVRKSVPDVSLATVYNTLGRLVRMRVLKLIDFESLDNRDIKRGFPVPPEEVKARAGFEVRDVRMDYYGTCAECGNRAKPGTTDHRAKRRTAWPRKRT